MISQSAAVLLLGISILSMAAAQLTAKAGVVALIGTNTNWSWLSILIAGLGTRQLWLAAALIGVGTVCWYLAMARISISVMVASASVLSPLVAVGAHIFIGERLTVPKVAAIAVIMVGVAWLAVQKD